eukprot:gene700-4578_t
MLFAVSSVFLLLYITSHAATSPAALPAHDDDANAHAVHLMEVWTQNAADAYVIAPMLLRTGTYNNVLRVRWYWNKHCIGEHIILYVSTDDTNYPDASSVPNNDLQQNSQNVIDIDLRPLTYSSGGIRNDDSDDRDSKKPPPPPRTGSWHVSDNYVVRNEDGNINQKQSILAIAQANGIKCDVLKASATQPTTGRRAWATTRSAKTKTNSSPRSTKTPVATSPRPAISVAPPVKPRTFAN